MARIGITKQQISKTAKEILNTGELPTATKIRAILMTGSLGTIQKYLKEWKKNCFDSSNYNSSLNLDIYNQKNNDELLEKQKTLEQTLNKQISKNEYYASELINVEKTIIKQTETNQQLQTTVQKLQNDLDSATKKKEALKYCYQKLTEAVASNHDITILQQEKTIESLRQEIQTINQTSFNAVQQVSFAGHDALLQEKVKTLNLEEKVKELQQLVVQQQNKLAILSKALQQQQPLECANYERIGHG